MIPLHALMPGRDLTINPNQIAHVRGASLRYFDVGEGDPVLLIHGTSLCDSLATPLRLYPPFYDHHRVISYYRAGYGGSTFEGAGVSIEDGARHLVELLDHLGIEKAHLVAYSFGGVISFEAILRYSDRFASAVLLEPYLPREGKAAIDANIAAFMSAMELYRAGDKIGAGLRYMEAVCGRDFLPAVQMTGPLDVWERAKAAMTTTFEVDFPAIAKWSFTPSQADAYAPKKTPVPVLACMGLQSESAMPGFRETQEFLMRWLPNVERAGIPFATHGMQSMNPVAVGEAACFFIARNRIGSR
jgi:pimeloyl-ACP methyl ester carboxylesterase